jgi:hypothetical protein
VCGNVHHPLEARDEREEQLSECQNRSVLFEAKYAGGSGFQVMPKGPKGQKRPADVIGNAVRVMQIATGEVEETETKNPIAVARGKLGGPSRAAKLSPIKRKAIAVKAARARWGRPTLKKADH